MRRAVALVFLSFSIASCEWLAGIDQKASYDDAGGATSASTGTTTAATGGGGSGGDGGTTSSESSGGSGGGGVPVCLTMCSGACTDTTSDPKHCGSCSVACAPGVACDGGICGRSLFRGVGSDSISAVKADGSLWAWGDDNCLQAGMGSQNAALTVPNRADALGVSIRYPASSGNATCALLPSGAVSCFGDNAVGQVGTTEIGGPDQCADMAGCVATPYPTLLSDVEEIAGVGWWTGGWHFCARKKNRTVWCWGDIDDTACAGTNATTVPQRMIGVHDAMQLAPAAGSDCVLVADGTVWCRGSNCSGQLGQGDFDEHNAAVQVQGLSGVTVIGGGIDWTCARAADGVYCWGANSASELGAGVTDTSRALPTRVADVPGFDDVIQIVGGAESTCALTAAGDVFCWGRGDYGIAGNGTYGAELCPNGSSSCFNKPTKADVSDVVEIAMGEVTAVARLRNGKLFAWGGDGKGQLGDGTMGNPVLTPVRVHGFP